MGELFPGGFAFTVDACRDHGSREESFGIPEYYPSRLKAFYCFCLTSLVSLSYGFGDISPMGIQSPLPQGAGVKRYGRSECFCRAGGQMGSDQYSCKDNEDL
jgi:hypothetical protein